MVQRWFGFNTTNAMIVFFVSFHFVMLRRTFGNRAHIFIDYVLQMFLSALIRIFTKNCAKALCSCALQSIMLSRVVMCISFLYNIFWHNLRIRYRQTKCIIDITLSCYTTLIRLKIVLLLLLPRYLAIDDILFCKFIQSISADAPKRKNWFSYICI